MEKAHQPVPVAHGGRIIGVDHGGAAVVQFETQANARAYQLMLKACDIPFHYWHRSVADFRVTVYVYPPVQS